jgi:hypothetical protein
MVEWLNVKVPSSNPSTTHTHTHTHTHTENSDSLLWSTGPQRGLAPASLPQSLVGSPWRVLSREIGSLLDYTLTPFRFIVICPGQGHIKQKLITC